MGSLLINNVFDALRKHLYDHIDRLQCFGKYEFQAEGWLKAECVFVLDDLKNRKLICNVDREIKSKGLKKIDLAIDLDDGRHWIELKHWFMGKQRGQLWRPIDFISGLESECKKFTAVQAGSRAWVAVLCTTNPGSSAWSTAIQKFNQEYSPWKLRSLDMPDSYPQCYFFGILQVQGLMSNKKIRK